MRVMNEDLPKSTIIVATAFWAVLAALMSWNLLVTSATSSKVDVLTSQRADDHDQITRLMSRTDQNMQRINEHDRQIAILETKR